MQHDAPEFLQLLCDEVVFDDQHRVGRQQHNLFPLKVPVVNSVDRSVYWQWVLLTVVFTDNEFS